MIARGVFTGGAGPARVARTPRRGGVPWARDTHASAAALQQGFVRWWRLLDETGLGVAVQGTQERRQSNARGRRHLQLRHLFVRPGKVHKLARVAVSRCFAHTTPRAGNWGARPGARCVAVPVGIGAHGLCTGLPGPGKGALATHGIGKPVSEVRDRPSDGRPSECTRPSPVARAGRGVEGAVRGVELAAVVTGDGGGGACAHGGGAHAGGWGVVRTHAKAHGKSAWLDAAHLLRYHGVEQGKRGVFPERDFASCQ